MSILPLAVLSAFLWFVPPASDSISANLDRWLKDAYPADEPGAAILVRQEGVVFLRKGYGRASLEWPLPVSPDTVFRLASVTKQFTAVAVLMLVEDGYLSLDEPVSTYLPDIHEAATIEQLLTHTAGLESLERVPGYPIWSRAELSPREVVGLFQDQPRSFPPGAGWKYSDAGYVLLGLVIEATTGLPYGAFIRQRIFEPLGMTSSYYDTGYNLIPRRASGYRALSGMFEQASFRSMSTAFSAGALASTVDDLARWDDALYGETLVSRALLARAFTPYILPDGSSTSYGYGWLVERMNGETVLQHGGRIEGFEAHVIRVPSRRIFIAVLSNAIGREPAPDFVATRILREIEGSLEDRADVTIQQLRDYVGIYRFDDAVQYQVVLNGHRLMMRNESGAEREFVPLGNDEFRFTTSYTRIDFRRSAEGAITGMTIKTPYDAVRIGIKTTP